MELEGPARPPGRTGASWTVTGFADSVTGWASVVAINVEDPQGAPHTILVDRRPAAAIYEAFSAGDVVIIQPPEPWQIISLPAAEDDDYDRCQAAGVHVCPPADSCDGA